MGREIGAGVVGYVVMAVFVMATFSLMYLILGTEGSFQPGSYEVSGAWVIGSIVLSLLGAIAGGWVCAAIAKRAGTPKALALVVLILGLAFAVPVLTGGGEAMLREGEVAMREAFELARQPTWLALLNPFIGAVGVLIGARRRASG